jgi:hypothetical protein
MRNTLQVLRITCIPAEVLPEILDRAKSAQKIWLVLKICKKQKNVGPLV